MTEQSGGSREITAADVVARVDDLVRRYPPQHTPRADFLGARFDAGLAWVFHPVGEGGLGAAERLQGVVEERLRDYGAPSPSERNPIGVGMAAPTLMAFGSDAQRGRLRALFAGTEIWCQLFSEPGAGSDLAGVATSAVRDGDEWVVNGQKVWTSLGHLARWGLLVARSDPRQPKHRGLTYFVLDMHAPGVDVRPLRQMTGEAEFNEVYFTDVRIPDRERLGEVGGGWTVALTTLMNERAAMGGFVPPRNAGLIGNAVSRWRERGGGDEVQRDQLAALWIESEVLRLTTIRSAQLREQGTPGPEGSAAKYKTMDLRKRIAEFTLGLLGPEGLLYESYDLGQSSDPMSDAAPAAKMYLRTRAHSIEGGTSEVLKNVLAERVLGLPPEPRDDKNVPWNEVPR